MKDSKNSAVRAGAERLRRAGLWVVFALVLLIPKLNRLRRRRKLWNFVRVTMVLAGAVIIALGFERGPALPLTIIGMVILLFALLVAPQRSELSIDARARELGALIVVDGGRYIDAAQRLHRAKLFIGPDQLWVLDDGLRVLLEVALQGIRAVAVEAVGEAWSFRVECARTTAQFMYEGGFAEHLARVADATLRSRLRRELPIFR